MKFRSDVAGYIHGVRFFKSAASAGPHTGSLWSASGAMLARATFVNETKSGWQEVRFSSPVAVSPKATYVASYFAPSGNYCVTLSQFASKGQDNGTLHALKSGVDGGNGVYTYGASAFPTQSYKASNYWVDVLFAPSGDLAPPIVVATSPNAGAAGIDVGAEIRATFNEAMTAGSITTASVDVRDPSNAPVAGTVAYDSGTKSLSFKPASSLLPDARYTVWVKGASTDPRVKDAAGNPMTSPSTWAFTTASASKPPSPPAPPPGVVTLPVEVMGTPTAEVAVPLNIDQTQLTAARRLSLLLHGIGYPQQASVRVNTGTWTPLTNATCTVEGFPAKYGGIGGPISNMRLSLPVTGLVLGANTISFRFNGTDGVSSGYRVRQIELLDSSANPLIKGAGFQEEDPNTWQPPLNTPTDIATGKQLWLAAPLRKNGLPEAPMMQARCTDCHAHDGRDLKYFNFSSFAIQKRAQFHGLTNTQGLQIASYIRSLSMPNPGRPWNPPFQPGAGLDAQPVENWSAGVGLNGVLRQDADALSAVFPNGISAEPLRPSARLNVREIPVTFVLPDWNKWLPLAHPKDTFGEDWNRSGALKLYAGEGTGPGDFNIRTRLLSGDPSYRTNPEGLARDMTYWSGQFRNLIQDQKARVDGFPRNFTNAIYSIRLWEIVKSWELHQEFGLEELPRPVYGASAEARGWFADGVWNAAPHELVNEGNPYIGISPLVSSDTLAGKSRTVLYFNNAWFYLSLITDNGNSLGDSAINWEYFQKFLNGTSLVGDYEPIRQLVVGIQASQKSLGPDALKQHQQWMLTDARLSQLLPEVNEAWIGFTSTQRRAVLQAYLDAWIEKSQLYQPMQYLVLGFYGPQYVAGTVDTSSMGYGFYLEFQMAARLGLNNNRAIDWAQRMWPAAPSEWDKIRN